MQILAYLVLSILLNLTETPRLLAQAGSMESLREQFIDNSQNNPSLYGGAPITHINPTFNTITYALGLEYPSYTITPDTEAPDYVANNYQSSKLELTGWRANPHISVSLRNIGLGFSVGRGEKGSVYESVYDFGGTYQRTDQKSDLEFSEVGLFLYFVPFPKIVKRLRATVIVGGRSINAKHTYTNPYFSTSNTSPSYTETIERYNVSAMELGLNFKFQVFKTFSIIPWADYEYIDTRSIEEVARSTNPYEGTTSQLETDIQLFWHSQPKFRYGIDFAARFSRFEINLGGLLGSLITTATAKESIKNDAIFLNVSFDQKGH